MPFIDLKPRYALPKPDAEMDQVSAPLLSAPTAKV